MLLKQSLQNGIEVQSSHTGGVGAVLRAKPEAHVLQSSNAQVRHEGP